MYEHRFNSVRPASECIPYEEISVCPPRPISRPKAYYAGQNLEELYHHIPNYRDSMPEIRLRIGVVKEATIFVVPAYDGLVIDGNGVALMETAWYTPVIHQAMGAVPHDMPIAEVEDCFVAFDAVSHVYYHWVCAMGAAGIANDTLGNRAKIAVPNYDNFRQRGTVKFSEDVYNQITSVVQDRKALIQLNTGVYRAKTAYILYADNAKPAEMTVAPLFLQQFAKIRRGYSGNRLFDFGNIFASRRRGRRILAARPSGAFQERMSEEETRLTARVAADFGFEQVFLEEMSAEHQVKAFSDAEAVLGPHGSGLINIVYANSSAKIIEIGMGLDGNRNLRPWFYIIAAAKGQDYALVNKDEGDLTEDRLRQCFLKMGL